MSTIDDLINELKDFKFGGNTGIQYATALGILVLSILFLYFLKNFILRRVNKLLKKNERLERVNTITDGLAKTLNFPIIFFFSVYFALQSLTVDPVITETIKFVLLLVVTYFLLKFSFVLVDYLIAFQSKYVESTSDNILEFAKLMLKTTLVVIFGLWFLSNMGIDTTAFVASLGVFAVAIAFALQNVIADIFAALTIYLDKPFEIGDIIVVGGEMGTVERIGIRSTRLRTLQGHMLIVSNRELISSRISNYQRMERRRVAFTLGVHYATRPSQLREIPTMMKEVINTVEDVQFDRCLLVNLGGSSIDFEIVYFVLSRSYTTYLRKHEEVILKLLDKLAEHDILIPYPTQTILLERTGDQGGNQ